MVILSNHEKPIIEITSDVIITQKTDIKYDSKSSIPIKLAIRAALALTLALDDADNTYSFSVDDGTVEGNVTGIETVGDLIVLIEKVELSENKDSFRLEHSKGPAGQQDLPSPPQTIRINLKSSSLLSIQLFSDPKLLSSTKASWLLQHFTCALHCIIASIASTLLSPIQYISPEELKTIQSFTKSPPQPSVYPSTCTTLPSFILHAASLYPAVTAIQFDDKTYSYSELIRLSKLFAQHLIKLGVKKGTIVPLLISKSAEMIFSMLGILLAGAGYLCLEPSLPSARQEGIINQILNAGNLLSTIGVAEEGHQKTWSSWKKFDDLINPIEFFRSLSASSLADELDQIKELPILDPQDTAYLVFTSGSSGTPKGVVISHSNVSAFLVNYRGVFGRAVGERVLQFPSYSFDVSVMNIWDTLAHGATLCMTSQENLLSDLSGSILRLNCTVVDLTPTVSSLVFEHFDALSRESESILDGWKRAGFKIKQCNTGGEKVDGATRDAWLKRGVVAVIDYGPSETTVGVISNQETSFLSGIIPIGRPTGSNEIYILSPSLAIVPLGVTGEICVGGDQVSTGYLDSSLNADVFVDHQQFGRIYRTGDLARYSDEKGNIECLGRKDNQVKINGLRIEVGEIEQTILASSNLVSRAVVDKIHLESSSPVLIGFVVLSSASKIFASTSTKDIISLPGNSSLEFNSLISELSEKLSSTLPSYMIPRYWIPINRIPTQGMGKTDRKTLLALASTYDFTESSRRQITVRSSNGTEFELVRKLWSKLLRVEEEKLDDEDSFTQLGGDSIAWMRFISMLRVEGYDIPYRILPSGSTISQSVQVLQSASQVDPALAKEYSTFSLIPPNAKLLILDELFNKFSLESTSIEDIYPTSPNQDSLLAASIDSSAYYAQAIYPIDPRISTELLSKALGDLVRLHPSLRTCFAVVDSLDQIIQVVLNRESDQVRKAVDVKGIRSDSARDMGECIEEWLQIDREQHSFEWGKLALSLAIFEFGDNKKLGFSMHHAISDGWTLELLVSDLRCLALGLPLALRPSYTTFVSHWANHDLTIASSFWSNYLKDSVPLPWPSNSRSTQFSTTESSTRHWNHSLQSLAKYGITPAIATRLAVFIACGHHASFCDVTLGIVRSGRDVDIAYSNEIVGCLVSVLPSRLLLSPLLSLLELAALEIEADRKSRENQLVTLGELARLQAKGTREDLFNILVTYQSLADRDPEEEETLPIRNPPSIIRMPTFYGLSVEITPHNSEQYELTAYYDQSALSPTEVKGFMNTVAQVLDTLIDSPKTTIGQLRLSNLDSSDPPPQQGYDTIQSIDAVRDLKVDSDMVDKIASVWISILRLPNDIPINKDASFSSLGGDSITMMRLSVRLKNIGLNIPMKELVDLSTINKQARWIALKGCTVVR